MSTEFYQLCGFFKENSRHAGNAASKMAACEFRKERDWMINNGWTASPTLFLNLRELYVKWLRLVLPVDEKNLQRELLLAVKLLYPHEYLHIEKYIKNNDILGMARGSFLLRGRVQSGKTLMTIILSLCQLIVGRDVVILLRRFIIDQRQFAARFNTVVKELGELGITSANFTISRRGCASNKPTLFIVGYTDENCRLIREATTARNYSTALFVDEGDLRRTTDFEFKKLWDEMTKVFFVTATPQDVFIQEWEIKSQDILDYAPSPKYRGFEAINCIEKNLLEKNEVFYTLVDIAMEEPIARGDHFVPKIILLSIATKQDIMHRWFDQLSQNKFVYGLSPEVSLPREMGNYCTIKFDGNGLYMHHVTFSREERILGQCVQRGIYKGNATVQEALLWLAQNGGVERFPAVIIISGLLAGRCVNFACYDVLESRNNWHLTHEILFRGETSHCTVAEQACRLPGNHGDQVPLKLYAPAELLIRLKQCAKLTNELVAAVLMPEHPSYKEENKSRSINEVITRLEIDRRDFPLKYSFNDTKFTRVRGGNSLLRSENHHSNDNIAYIPLFGGLSRVKQGAVDHFISAISPNEWHNASAYYTVNYNWHSLYQLYEQFKNDGELPVNHLRLRKLGSNYQVFYKCSGE